MAMTLNMRAPPNSCTQTSVTPERPARSTSSQIMPAFITHLLKEKSDGGRIGEAMPRIASLLDALDLHQRLLARARSVITRELAEGSFLRLDGLDHLAFEHDLGMGRHWQAVKLAQHDLVRLTAVAAGIVVFAETEFELVAAGEE